MFNINLQSNKELKWQSWFKCHTLNKDQEKKSLFNKDGGSTFIRFHMDSYNWNMKILNYFLISFLLLMSAIGGQADL